MSNNVNNLVSGVTSQAFDDGSGNKFSYNYWDDHDNTDDDGDGLADSGYDIDGSAENSDESPLKAIGAIYTPISSEPFNPFLMILVIIVILVVSAVIIGVFVRRRRKARRR